MAKKKTQSSGIDAMSFSDHVYLLLVLVIVLDQATKRQLSNDDLQSQSSGCDEASKQRVSFTLFVSN